MSYGFSATNTNGQVLLSETTKNLHFYDKAILVTTVPDTLCGGFNVYTYTSVARGIPIPFFTMPSAANTYGITRIYGNPGNWQIEIVHGVMNGTAGLLGPAPEVYTFCDLTNRDAPAANDNMGLIVYNAYGEKNYDSRYRPLIITNGWYVAPPVNPYYNSIDAGAGSAYYDEQVLSAAALYATNRDSAALSSSFSPKNVNAIPGAQILGTKPIYSYSAMGQCERDATFSDHSDWYVSSLFGSRYGGTIWASSLYWCFYRSAIGRFSNDLFCSWAPAKRGYAYSVRRDEAGANGIFGLVGMAAGAAFGGVGGAFLGVAYGSTIQVDPNTTVTSNGLWPYSNKTLNTGASAVLVSDGALYD